MGFRQKVIARLEELGMSRQELAIRSGVSKSYIYKLLMDGHGNRENPSNEIKQRIATAIGLTVSDLEDAPDVKTYLITALYELPQEKRKELTAGTPNDRFLVVVQLIKAAHPDIDDDQISNLLGIPVETFEQLMRGSPMDSVVMQVLSERTGLSVRFWLRGRLDPNPRLVNLLLESDQVADILEIAEQIITKRVSTEVVRDLVEIVAKGGA